MTAPGDSAPEAALRIVHEIRTVLAERASPMTVMEFCGGHTHAIMRYGIRDLLSPHVRLISGPGCPVCVTSLRDVDMAIALAHEPGIVLATFGDMLRVPGSTESLAEARAAGADVRVVYSAQDGLDLARAERSRQVVMLGVGFETTAPTIAATIDDAQREGVTNYSVLSLHKLTPPAMRAILQAGDVRLDGVLGPGHVTAITGWQAWMFLADECRVSCAVAGFGPIEILTAVRSLARACADGQPRVSNDYPRGVTREGNRAARNLMSKVFVTVEAEWRGLGTISDSGCGIAPAYAEHDALRRFADVLAAPVAGQVPEPSGCRCGEVLRGVLEPPECALFGRACTPTRAVGPCMVSAEGACAAHFAYGVAA